MSSSSIEVIARGVLLHEGKVLICRNRKHGHLFLPGGHVDFAEPASAALEREVLEELGVRLRATRFLGTFEASFNQLRRSGEAVRHHEINLVFQLATHLTGSNDDSTVALGQLSSIEDHIEFVWLPLEFVRQDKAGGQARRVLPTGIMRMVADALAAAGEGVDSEAPVVGWGSAFED